MHNQVNLRLKKPDFDCRTVTDVYKCGCADADDAEGSGTKNLPPGEDLLGPLPPIGKEKGHDKKEETDSKYEEAISELQGVQLEVEE